MSIQSWSVSRNCHSLVGFFFFWMNFKYKKTVKEFVHYDNELSKDMKKYTSHWILNWIELNFGWDFKEKNKMKCRKNFG